MPRLVLRCMIRQIEFTWHTPTKISTRCAFWFPSLFSKLWLLPLWSLGGLTSAFNSRFDKNDCIPPWQWRCTLLNTSVACVSTSTSQRLRIPTQSLLPSPSQRERRFSILRSTTIASHNTLVAPAKHLHAFLSLLQLPCRKTSSYDLC